MPLIDLDLLTRTYVEHSSSKRSPISKDKSLMSFRTTECLAHIIPYMKLDNSSSIAMYDEDGEKREYTIKKIMGTHPGLVCYILYSEDPNNSRIHVTFKGTHNLSSAMRNLENPTKPGKYSYFNDEELIVGEIEEIVATQQKKCIEKVKLTLAGHSLGGADCQNCASSLLKRIAKKKPPLSDVASLTVMHCNAVGVGESVASEANQNAIQIKKQNPKFEIRLRCIAVEGDPIQQAGHRSIFSGEATKVVDAELLKARISSSDKNLYISGLFMQFLNFFKVKSSVYEAHTLRIFEHESNSFKPVNGKCTFKILSRSQSVHDSTQLNRHLDNKITRTLFSPIDSYKNNVISHITPLIDKIIEHIKLRNR